MGVVLYAQKYTEIKGFVKNDRLKEVHLYRVEDGTTHSYASTMVAEDGSYGFLFCPEKPGFYTVGNDKQMDFVVYVKVAIKSISIFWKTGPSWRERILKRTWPCINGKTLRLMFV